MGRRAGLLVLIVSAVAALPAAAAGQVLRVGSYHRIPGQFTSIQNALNAARPGDWVLVGPGDYKTTGSEEPSGKDDVPAGVLMTTPRVYLRGMNRNTVIVDGTKPGSPVCSSAPSDQNLGPSGDGGPLGLNGIEVFKAADDWVQNLTACNFLGGTGSAGNEIWWNGGDDSGTVGGQGYYGSYLNATSTYFGGEGTAAEYGIFSSNWSGGTWDQTYASNFNDSGYYIGACQQVCDQTIDHAWAQYNALGYSGTNSGGPLVVENSQFDHNEDGFDTNSQNADQPSPQDGACPAGVKPPVPGAQTCWVFVHNYVHDNNNPNVPAAGSAAAGPVGTGMSLSGAHNDTVMDNRFENNGAWGVIVVPYPDSGPPCTGGTQTQAACVFDESGIAVIDNAFANNGTFGNPTNGDIAAVNTEPGPTDCYSGNTEESGGAATTSPSNLQQTYPSCNGATVPPNSNPLFLGEVACDSESIALAGLAGGSLCLPGANYPRHGAGQPMPALPAGLPSMPHVCSGVSPDPWCGGQVRTIKGCAARTASARLALAVRERFVSVSVRVGRGRAVLRRVRGGRTRVRYTLGSSHSRRRVRVHFLERIRVRGHRETVRFTRVYELCARGGGNV